MRTTRASLHRGGDDYQLPSEVPAGAAVAAGAVVRFADGGAAARTREGKGKVTFGGSSRAQLALQQAEGAEHAESSSCTALVAAEPAAQLVSNGPTLSDDTTPSASLDCLKARATPTHPGAQPEHLGSYAVASGARLRPPQS